MTEEIIIGGIIALAVGSIPFAIDILNARRAKKNKKFEILSQISETSYKDYRAAKSQIHFVHVRGYYITAYNELLQESQEIKGNLVHESDEQKINVMKADIEQLERDKLNFLELSNFNQS